MLVSRIWPARAFLYAELKEAGLDVCGVDAVDDLAEALWRWPDRFGAVLMDPAGFPADDVARAVRMARRAGLSVLLVAGPWDLDRLADRVTGARMLRKPVTIGAVVDAVRRTLRAR
ncbi:hypothetical protein [Deferrisoma camini]|uniref:hypothetical protein n=1 Tax=Deferrisoma camini TaxID=1035120 RepID=UPI00046CFFE7|nr:hypothetical protein [Deferrisoma camini]